MLRHFSGPQTALKAAPNSKGLVLNSHEGSRLLIGAGSISFFVVILTLFLGTHTVWALAAVDLRTCSSDGTWAGKAQFGLAEAILL